MTDVVVSGLDFCGHMKDVQIMFCSKICVCQWHGLEWTLKNLMYIFKPA